MDGFSLLMNMKFEWMILLIIFILLFMKLQSREWKTTNVLIVVNILLLANFGLGFFMNNDGTLFGNTFVTTKLIELQKNILNLGALIISTQAYSWLRTHKHVLEFYMLLLSTLLGMFLMISGGNLLMFLYRPRTCQRYRSQRFAILIGKTPVIRGSDEADHFIAFSSGLLLFGISLLYGTTGTLDFTQLLNTWTEAPCNCLHLFYYWQVLPSKFLLFHFIYGRLMFTKDRRYLLRLTCPLFQKLRFCLSLCQCCTMCSNQLLTHGIIFFCC
jgi:NADH-quinone oxidoreductase subunit N